jgi:hypothetical protein
MPYIGNTPTTQSFSSGTDYFNGNASQTAFTLSRAVASINDVQVVVNNVAQAPNSGYTISGNTLTFDAAPSIGTNNVYVRYLSTTTQVITPSQNSVSYNSLNTDMQQDIGISFKNRIINGNMRIDQRNNGASVTSNNSGQYGVDRFFTEAYGGGSLTSQRSIVAPTGFTNSLLITVTGTDTSLGTADDYEVNQKIEGFNVADMGWGTANAQTITLSFWVRSSVTGSYSIGFQNSSASRSFVATYTINSANTWEQKSITVVGDTSGSWETGNGAGFFIRWCLATGTNRVASSTNTWEAANRIAISSTANPIMGTSGATFYITGVQLEKGTTATAFDNRAFGTELQLCQRYYYQITSTSGPYSILGVNGQFNNIFSTLFPVTMRAAPTGTFSNSSSLLFTFSSAGGAQFSSTPTSGVIDSGVNGARFYTPSITGQTGLVCWYDIGVGNGKITLNSEL